MPKYLKFTALWTWLLGLAPVFAAEHPSDHLPDHAEEIFHLGPFVVTNSMLSVWIVALIVILVAQASTRKLSIVPGKLQNFIEWITEGVYDLVGSLLGPSLAKRTFWLFGTIFIFILAVNWFGLIPGIGTIGWKLSGAGVDPHDNFRPFLRGGNADLNMVFAMSLTFMLLWLYWAVAENGVKGFLAHLFAPKGQFKGLMLILMIVVFFAVGILEIISIAFRPISLSFRLFGNIFAGENVLENMLTITGSSGIGQYLAWLPSIPFYFLELLVGLIQAMVFLLLTVVYLKLICDHGEEHESHEESVTGDKAG